MHPLLDPDVIDRTPDEYLSAAGTVFARFDARTRDSGNVSYGLRVGETSYFVKTAGAARSGAGDAAHARQVALLRNAVRLARICPHPALAALLHVIESPEGPCLVYEWLPGELLGVPRAERENPSSPFQRFRRLPAPVLETCLDTVFDLHHQLALAGWIAVDFYDGSLLYDFAAGRLRVVDLDLYRRGPFTNDMGRMFGSTRFMAPEEFEFGARIDERTTVHAMGRTALVFLSDGTDDPRAFRGSPRRLAVAARACDPDGARRYPTLAAFHEAWRLAGPA